MSFCDARDMGVAIHAAFCDSQDVSLCLAKCQTRLKVGLTCSDVASLE